MIVLEYSVKAVASSKTQQHAHSSRLVAFMLEILALACATEAMTPARSLCHVLKMPPRSKKLEAEPEAGSKASKLRCTSTAAASPDARRSQLQGAHLGGAVVEQPRQHAGA